MAHLLSHAWVTSTFLCSDRRVICYNFFKVIMCVKRPRTPICRSRTDLKPKLKPGTQREHRIFASVAKSKFLKQQPEAWDPSFTTTFGLQLRLWATTGTGAQTRIRSPQTDDGSWDVFGEGGTQAERSGLLGGKKRPPWREKDQCVHSWDAAAALLLLLSIPQLLSTCWPTN